MNKTELKWEDIVTNINIYGLHNSFRVAQFPMAVDTTTCTPNPSQNILNLGSMPAGTGHNNYLKGIIVQFDLTFTIKAWTEAERYHWFDIVSSQSTMHRINKMDFDSALCDWVTEPIKEELNKLKNQYNANPTPENYLTLLYNCPVGLKLTAGITTNYLQLKTIYHQRHNHRLLEWRVFCQWIKRALPFSETLICKEAQNEE